MAVILKKQPREAMQAHDPEQQTRDNAGLAQVVAAQRALLQQLRRGREVSNGVYRHLEEELDWVELAARPNRHIEVLEA